MTKKKKATKKFDHRLARKGAEVETNAGHSVRLLCYDTKSSGAPITGLLSQGRIEIPMCWSLSGKAQYGDGKSSFDLCLVEEGDL